MSKTDKQNVQVLAIILVLLGSAVFFFYSSRMVPFEILAGLAMALECLYLVPKLIDLTFSIFEEGEAGAWKWIPIVNEIILYGGAGTKVCGATLAGAVVLGGLALLPVASIPALAFVADLKYKLLFGAIVLVLVFFTERFIYMWRLQEELYTQYYQLYEARPKNNFLMMILAPIPVIRGTYLSYLIQTAEAIDNALGSEYEEEFVEE